MSRCKVTGPLSACARQEMKVVAFTTIINVAVFDDLQYAANNNKNQE